MIKVSCIVLVGLAAAALLRQRSAAARHWVLAAAIACAAVTPILEYTVPSWQLPPRVTQIVQRPGTLTLYTPVEVKSADAGANLGVNGRSALRATIARALTFVWLAGIGAGLTMLAIGFTRLVRVTSRARRIDRGLWAGLAREIAGDFGIAPPAILQSDHPSLCVTWGMRRPVVILPHGADAWPESRARSVVGHELAHIARRDWPVQITAELLRAVYWFNPLVWIACTQLRRESEHACDDAVLGLGVQGPDYAGHLLDLARAFKVHGHMRVPAPAMARPSSLERRVRAMLNVHVNRTPLTRSACALVAGALLLVTLPVAAAQSGPASFSGTLMDAVGRVMPDVTLTLAPGSAPQKPGAAAGTIAATSDANGHFSFANLPAGDYTLQVQKMGFGTTQGRVSVDSGQNLVQNIALQVAALMETITVTEPDPGAPAAVRAPHRPLKSPSTADDACAQTTVGGCITVPVKLFDVKPIWPESLAGTGASATLKMEAHIGTDGFVNDVRVLAPARDEFVTAAAAAVRQWQFSQTLLDGVPVEVRMTVLVSFKAR